jgi:L,D-transpeptidase catalytic domain
MATTRRSFAAPLVRMASLAPAAAALLPARAPRAETAATLPGPAELPALIRRAAEPFARSCRARAAVEGSLGRLDAAAAADHLRGRRGVLVNIAGAEAVAWEEDGSEVLRTRVIVGAARTPTPRLASPVPSIRLNPPWYVPRSIEPEIRGRRPVATAASPAGG